VFLGHASQVIRLPLVEPLERLAYDARMVLTLPGTVGEGIVIVDIDEHSLQREGHWPWPRDRLAFLVDTLFDHYDIASLGFDVVFAERDTGFELPLLEELGRAAGDEDFVARLRTLAPELDRDRRFAAALENRPVSLGYYFHVAADAGTGVGALPPPVFDDDGFMRWTLFPVSATGYGANLPVLQAAATNGGFFSNPLIDPDGVMRRVPLLHEYDDALYGSLALAVVSAHLGVPVEPVFSDELIRNRTFPRLEALRLGTLDVPLDAAGALRVPYRGRAYTFPYVSAADVLARDIDDPDRLRGAIVLIGSSAPGLADLRSTPIQGVFPGVEIHANIVHAILQQSYLYSPPWAPGAHVTITAGLGGLLAITFPWLGPLWLTLAVLLALAAVIAGNLYAWTVFGLVLPLVGLVLMVLSVYAVNVAMGYFMESRDKLRIRSMFRQYLAPALVDRLAEHPETLRLSGESREMTFLFTDLEGFTSLTERTAPQALVSLLNEYLDGACAVVMDHGGTVDKIVGDAVHGMFNAPLDQPDHAQRAVEAALALDAFCTEFSARQRAGGIELGVTRIGVNTGVAVVGNFGGQRRFDYTAHGDAINTAARLESVNKHLGTRICIAGSTAAGCSGVAFRPIASLVLKGKTDGVDTFEPVDAEAAETPRIRDYVAAWQQMHEGGPDAPRMFAELTVRYPDDPLIQLHAERLARGESGSTLVMSAK